MKPLPRLPKLSWEVDVGLKMYREVTAAVDSIYWFLKFREYGKSKQISF